MKLEFSKLDETVIPHFMNGEGAVSARMYVDAQGKIMYGELPPGASIGMHTHETSSEIVYVLAGSGAALYDGERETLAPGDCHYCPKGHSHSLINDGDTPMAFFAVVPNQ